MSAGVSRATYRPAAFNAPTLNVPGIAATPAILTVVARRSGRSVCAIVSGLPIVGGDVQVGEGKGGRIDAPDAQAAARALLDNTELDARNIVQKGLNIAADICVYTNHNLTLEELEY